MLQEFGWKHLHLHNPGDGDFLGGVCMHYNIDHGINISLDPRFLC